ncbi:MAG: TolC family protein [Pseudomonadota bacterium]
MHRLFLALLLAAIGLSTNARAQQALAELESEALSLDEALSLEQVLASAQQHYPEILESLAKRQIASQQSEVAAGAFDLVFDAEGFDRLNGFYDGRVLKAGVAQPLRPFGASVFSEYKISDGTFPIYEDENFTNTGGTLSAGVLFSLLRDRDIDQRRFDEFDATIALDNADLELLMVRIGIQQRATVAYWQWVAAGAQLAVFEELLNIAIQRETGLQQEVNSGARARIFLTENRQNIVRRRSLAISARELFENSANTLALYYRDASGSLLLPAITQLPSQAVLADAVNATTPRSIRNLPQALALQPKLRLLENSIRRTEEEIALRRNELQPRLDLRFEVATGFGEIGAGGPSRDTTDPIIGFDFTVPLERRAAKAKLSQSLAKRSAFYQQQRMVMDQIEVQIRDIFNTLSYAERLALLAAEEVNLADTMRLAEQQRFKEGASDFFLVNVREEAAANARVSYLSASLDSLIARTNFDAATINLDALGLSTFGLK